MITLSSPLSSLTNVSSESREAGRVRGTRERERGEEGKNKKKLGEEEQVDDRKQ